MTLRIARMRIRLPASRAARAADIARAVAQAVAHVPLAHSRSFDTMALGPLSVAHGAPDGDVAAAVARSLGSALKEKR